MPKDQTFLKPIDTASVLLCANTAFNIANFRMGLLRYLVEKGIRVLVVAPEDVHSRRIQDVGCRFISVPIASNRTNPIEDLSLLLRMTWLYRSLRPNLIFHYTIKPNIYGNLAARLAGVSSIAVITGLGYVFSKENWVSKVARILYRAALRCPKEVWFLNEHDRTAFVDRRLVDPKKVFVLPGSGVDTQHFAPREVVGDDEPVVFLLIARLLWDKGVGEFVEAARRMRSEFSNARFQLLGAADTPNPMAIGRRQVQQWVNEGVVEYLGTTDDVRPFIAKATCVVLPSYSEGVPRSLLEGASMARPIITTDSAGCRDVVVDGQTGFLCAPRSAQDLADKIKTVLSLSAEQRREMGHQGRQLVISRFDEKIVIQHYRDALMRHGIAVEEPRS